LYDGKVPAAIWLFSVRIEIDINLADSLSLMNGSGSEFVGRIVGGGSETFQDPGKKHV